MAGPTRTLTWSSTCSKTGQSRMSSCGTAKAKAAVEAIKNAGGKLTATTQVKEKTAALKKRKAAPAEELAADKDDDVGTDKE